MDEEVVIVEERPGRDEAGNWQVEAIGAYRAYWTASGLQEEWLVKWLGWPESAATWEPIENLQGCLHLVNEFTVAAMLARAERDGQ